MGGTHFVKLRFQLTHIPLHFLYGCSVEKEKKAFEITWNHDSILSTSQTKRKALKMTEILKRR